VAPGELAAERVERGIKLLTGGLDAIPASRHPGGADPVVDIVHPGTHGLDTVRGAQAAVE
jgi:hypothetical protein